MLNPKIDLPIIGYGLILRGFRQSDKEQLARMVLKLHEQGMPVIAPKYSSPAAIRVSVASYFEDIRNSSGSLGDRSAYFLVIADAEDPNILKGCISLSSANPAIPELGCFVDARCQSKGYGKRAGFLLLERYFEFHDLCDAVAAKTSAENIKAQRSLEKLGFIFHRNVPNSKGSPVCSYKLSRKNFHKAYDRFVSEGCERHSRSSPTGLITPING